MDWSCLHTWWPGDKKVGEVWSGLDERAQATLACVLKAVGDHLLTDLVPHCESPIERVMALSLWFAAFVVSATDERYVTVIPQWEVPTESGTFRADFAIIERHKDDVQLLLLVECDGHDYHEKTKQQAAKDKRRDRALKLAGFDVLHFTGSEIWRDPVACGIEVLKYLRAQRDREDQP